VKTLNREQARRLDRRAVDEFGVPSIVLMENAGRGVADKLCALGAASPVAICCGSGNNGGDGFVIARHLDLRGIEPRVLLWSPREKLAGDALINFKILEHAGIAIHSFAEAAEVPQFERQLAGASWIVDALLGTGAAGAPRAPLDSVIAAINRHGAPVLAVDVPSGVDCDTGEAPGAAVRAAHTCTFVAMKPGFVTPDARHYTGQIHVLDIGAPQKLIDDV
jgi:NAD(P)H-hydrate epimerase